jgi:hypothetical protein
MTCDMDMTFEDWNEMLEERKLAMDIGEYDCGQVDNDDYDDDYDGESEEKENCNICHAYLKNHNYGNVCKKHIPSYALWDDDTENEIIVEDIEDNKDIEMAPPCVLSHVDIDWNEWNDYIDWNGGDYDSGYEDNGYEDNGYEDEGYLEMF